MWGLVPLTKIEKNPTNTGGADLDMASRTGVINLVLIL